MDLCNPDYSDRGYYLFEYETRDEAEIVLYKVMKNYKHKSYTIKEYSL